MSFFKASTDKKVLQQGGSNHITGSGLYPVTILAPVVSTSGNGSTTVDMFVEYQGQKQIVYGNLRITNNDGSENTIGAKTFNQLMIIADLDEVSEPVSAELPIGKKGAMKDADVLEDLCDVEVIMRVQLEYSAYKGNIQEKKVIKAFFRASDKATAEEIVNGSEVGVGYEKEEKYANNVTYKDNLTEEDITAWIAAKRPKGTAGGGAGASAGGKKAAPSFGNKKKRFGKSEADAEESGEE